MVMAVFLPDPDLADCVDGIWVHEIDVPNGETAALTILPASTAVICVQYKTRVRAAQQDRELCSAVTGVQSQLRSYLADGPTGSVVARFSPWGAVTVLNLSMESLTNQHLDLREIYPPSRVEQLEEEIAEAPTAAAKAGVMQAFLRQYCRPQVDRRVAAAVQAIRDSGGTLAIPELAARVGLSERQLRRRFLDGLGVSPKMASRIVRFQQAVRLRSNGADWLTAALDAGYFDQAHLIREIRELTGGTPREFVGRTPSEMAHYFNLAPAQSGFIESVFL